MTKENIKYKALTAIRYFGDGFFYPFFALYLVSRNMTTAQIGFILSISPLLAIFANPIYTKICKSIKITKLVLGIISILEGLMILAIGFSANYYLIAALTILMAAFGACHYGLMDSLLAIYADNSKQNYSGIRLFGSASYILATAVSGYICKEINYQLSFAICALAFLGSGILYIILKDINIEINEEKKKVSYKPLFKNKAFVFFFIFYGLMSAMIFTNNNFFSTYLETRGIYSDTYGLVFSYFVAVELVVLLVLSKIKKKITPYLLLIIASICLVVRLFICYIDAPIWLVIASSGLRGVGFAIMLHVSYQYVVSLVGEELSTSGIMLCTLLYSVLLFILNNANGQLIDMAGYNTYFLINVIIAVILTIYSCFLLIMGKKKEDSNLNEVITDE